MAARRSRRPVGPSPPPLAQAVPPEMRLPPNSWAAQTPASAAVLAAKTYLAGQPGIDGTVSIANGVVMVTTSAQEPTILLSVIGIGSVSGQGSARVNIVPDRSCPMIMQFRPTFKDETMTIDTDPRTTHIVREGAEAAGSAAAGVPATPQPPRMPGRRNPKWIALGIVALCLGGLLSYMIYAESPASLLSLRRLTPSIGARPSNRAT